jgi:uncharacterized protein (TIGR03067 family)
MDASPYRSEIISTLLGAWRIVRIVETGAEVPLEDDQFLWFKHDIIVTGDEWAAWDMPYMIRADRQIIEIDIHRDDRHESWLQAGIMEIEGDNLQICAAGSPSHSRPEDFRSTMQNENMLWVAQRCDEPLPD